MKGAEMAEKTKVLRPAGINNMPQGMQESSYRVERRRRHRCLHWISPYPIPEDIFQQIREMDRRVDDPNTTIITFPEDKVIKMLEDPEEMVIYISFRCIPYNDVICIYGDIHQTALLNLLKEDEVFESGSLCEIQDHSLARALEYSFGESALVIQT